MERCWRALGAAMLRQAVSDLRCRNRKRCPLEAKYTAREFLASPAACGMLDVLGYQDPARMLQAVLRD